MQVSFQLKQAKVLALLHYTLLLLHCLLALVSGTPEYVANKTRDIYLNMGRGTNLGGITPYGLLFGVCFCQLLTKRL